VDRLLDFNEKAVLTHAGSVSREAMERIARERFDAFDENRRIAEARLADAEEIAELARIEKQLEQKKDTMGAMGISPLEGIVSPDYHVYTSKGLLLPEFVELLCRSKPFIGEVNRWSKGVWSSRLYPENFFEMRLPVPPHEDQRDIIAAVEESQHKNKELPGVMQQSIALAQERRSALITAAVTGQIPVEEMAA